MFNLFIGSKEKEDSYQTKDLFICESFLVKENEVSCEFEKSNNLANLNNFVTLEITSESGDNLFVVRDAKVKSVSDNNVVFEYSQSKVVV